MSATKLARGGAAAAALALCAGLLTLASTSASAAPGCSVDYRVNQWDSGFTANVTLKNLGDAISGGWTLEWDFPGTQKITNGWSATYAQSGQHVSAKSPEWASSLPTGGSATIGFNA